MEPARGKHNASKLASEDIISRMPENVITHILDRLPIQYAVRTAILSRNWRFKWTLLSQLIFDKEFSEYLEGLGGENWYDERNISRLLLHLKGSITTFILYIPNGKVLDVKGINHWVMFLSRKGIKEFTLVNMNVTPLELSTHLFSCVELEHLTLCNCSFHPAPTFCSFPNLLSLEWDHVVFENGNFGEIITQCPLLEFLKVSHCDPIGKVKMVEIAKLKKLKWLSLPLCELDNIAITSSLVFHLVGHFPELQELNLIFFLRESDAGKWVRTSFPCLETLILYPIDFSSSIRISFAFKMIWGLPELQTLKITAAYNDAVPSPAFWSLFKYKTMGQLQLQSVVFECFRGSENELCLIQKLLACSPLLKRMVIYPPSSKVFGGNNGKLMFATKLLKFRRASTIVEIEIYWS